MSKPNNLSRVVGMGDHEARLRDLTRGFWQRERVLNDRISDLERQVRNLRLELSLKGRLGPLLLPQGCYRDARTGEATGIKLSSWASGKNKSGGKRATTSSHSGTLPKVQGRAQPPT